MAAVYSTRFALLGEGQYTAQIAVPDGYVWVLRDFSGWFGVGGLVSANLSINTLVSPVIQVYGFSSPTGNTSFQWHGRIVVNPQDTVSVGVNTLTGSAGAALSGYILSLP